MRWTLLLGLLASCAVSAQQPAPGANMGSAQPSIAQAIEAAWQRSVVGSAAIARRDEQAARRAAAGAWTPEPPSLTVSQRTDRFNGNQGMRETEAELEVPLWMPGTRAAALALADAEGGAFEAGLQRARLKLAGEVREAVWALRIAANEVEAGERRVAETESLAADVDRRVKAGNLARIDANSAQAAVHQARISLAQAKTAQLREQRLFAALTGLTALPAGSEEVPGGTDIDSHPEAMELARSAELARAHLRQASAETRDAPALILGVTRERADFGERYANTTRIGIRIPFGTDSRNRPRIAEANAALTEAEASAAFERERLRATIDAARAEVEQARAVEGLSAERAKLAGDTLQLLDKAFRLGEIDLPTRLRAENDSFDATLALSRARLEAGRANSRLQQAYGRLP